MLSLPSTLEMIASLDAELVDLLGERMKLATTLDAERAPEEVELAVQQMRALAGIYGAPQGLVEQVARLLYAAETPAGKG
ncbi:hypothetical protein RA280_14420 [Cupriavidus sp. CV2]|uniref:hypothetical protein n=1 Tax=Cupriavidus ulmosensis TaxID=3065913 RepID=UPI00296AB9A0|nr:hypothetical protein [Cupriavidus sp. CV2]MDW3682920.1 hypothetical protein [Cupriavidus sp. CV2]